MMPFLFPRRTSVSATPSRITTQSTPVVEVALKKRPSAPKESNPESPSQFLSFRRRRKSSSSSISKSSISRPTSQASMGSSLPLTPSTSWTPSLADEPAFENPRQSPVPQQSSTSMELQALNAGEFQVPNSTQSRPKRRPVPLTDIPRVQQQDGRVVQRVASQRSDISITKVLEIDEESDAESDTRPDEDVLPAISGPRLKDSTAVPSKMTAGLVYTPTSPTVRQNIFKPPQPRQDDDDQGYRAMTVWERIGERRAREMGTESAW